ncbi:dynein intermediate chain 3, axonemal [Caerostris extrusa]|uniref:Dynein intermediate chain 3, axonemal n=1 Tax=Caerostris extrusa TaxID=172846 RepID=A0AAV4P2Q3_CAEEX|nr:dynein intermediate chain 3, axonemal [Caerostris extrusa]
MPAPPLLRNLSEVPSVYAIARLPSENLSMVSRPFCLRMLESSFLNNTLDSLVQNSTADSFCWELTSLYDEETSLQDEEEGLAISGSFSCTESKESEKNDIFVASTISCSTLEKRTENLLRLRNDSVLYFMWSARNQFFPKLVLEYFDDLTVINFNPIKPNLLVGGSLSGQLVLWDVKQEMYDRDHTNISKAEFTSPPIVRCCAISIVNHVHKYGVTDVQWVPQNIEITSKGEIIHNTASGYQLITCGISGTLKFWDLRMGVLTKPGNPPPKKFNHLNGIWEPFHSIEVLSLDGRRRKSLKCFVMRNGSKSVGQGKDDNGSYNSEFLWGCDDGDILCGSFKLTRDESGKLITKQPEYFNSPLGGAVTVLACSPFMKDVLLTTGGKTIAIWKHDIKNVPVYLKERRAYITSGQWSPTRPALFLLGFQDGSIEDVYVFFLFEENQHLVAAGDSKGIVYTMDLLPSLWIPTENEKSKSDDREKSPQDTEKQSQKVIGEPAGP